MRQVDPREVDWQNKESIWFAEPSNHRLAPGGTEYVRYEWVRAQIPRGAVVLDVGCNCGQLAANLVRDLGCTVVGVDVVPAFIQHCNQKKAGFGTFYQMDFSRARLPVDWLGRFDVVTALEVIEHPIDVRGFCENVAWVLKPGGRLVVTTPHPESPQFGYTYLESHAHHVRMWSRWRLEQAFGPLAAYEEIHIPGRGLCQIGAAFVKEAADG